MDFSSLNPTTSNALNLAARKNDFQTVHRLLKKINPNCIDNRGWTCLHEAAANDSYQSMMLILKHPDCRPFSETHEGHTALYLACQQRCSLKTIKALLQSAEDIANYGSTECVTPLHLVCSPGRVEIIQLLLDYGAIINVQDFDGDTPLHDAALGMQPEAATVLLHAGADPDIRNESYYLPFHLACAKGHLPTVKALYPYMTHINQITVHGDTPLILATQCGSEDVVKFLLDNGADPHIVNTSHQLALNLALTLGHYELFKILLNATDKSKINKNIVQTACKPHYFKLDILEELLNYDLGPEFFVYYEKFYVSLEEIGNIRPVYKTNAPLNSFLNICEYIYNSSPDKFREFFYLFLYRGVSVDAINIEECPPLVYIHYSAHANCFTEVFKMLREFGCDVDYCSVPHTGQRFLPDAFVAALTSDPSTLPLMIQCSLQCEPGDLLLFAFDYGLIGRIPQHVQNNLLLMIDHTSNEIKTETLSFYIPPLKHLCRLKIRHILRLCGIKSTNEFFRVLDQLTIPRILKEYLRYV